MISEGDSWVKDSGGAYQFAFARLTTKRILSTYARYLVHLFVLKNALIFGASRDLL